MMKNIFVFILFILTSIQLHSQSSENYNQDLKKLSIAEHEKLTSYFSDNNYDNLSKIKPLQVLQYLASINEDEKNESIKLLEYIFPKDWLKKEDVVNLIQYVYSTKPAYKINHKGACCSTPKKTTVGYEAMHLISLYRYKNFNYPALCFLCDKKDQNEMGKDFISWWKKIN